MRLSILLGVLAALFGVYSFVVAQTTTDRMRPITSALRAGQFDQALQLLQPELQQSPQNAQLWTLEGIALSGKGDKKEALGAFRHALGISPDYLPALEGAAQIEYENGGKDAVALLQHVLELRPSDPTSHAMLAVVAYRRGDCATAVLHFEKSGSLVDSQPGALQQYGDCLVSLKETEKAISVFGRALAQSNADGGARYRLASVQMIAQHPKDAIETLQPLLQNHPDAAVLALAGEAYEADKDTPQAVKLLRQAIVQDPQNVDLYVQFANVSFVHQSFQVGIDMIDAGLSVQPKAAPLYLARGILYVQLADYDHAEADFEKANELDPQLALTEAAQGMIAEQRNDLDKALAVVRAKLAKRPNDAFLLYVQADILLQKNPDTGGPEFRQAVASARKAANLQPSLVYAHDTLAKLDLQAGQDQQAVDESKQALRYDPKDQVALYHLIVGLRKTGRKAELPDLLKRLAELRQEATKEEAEHNRYKLVEQAEPGESQKAR
jgi:tetratricopeptide (TPR) repeat protein